MIKKYLLASSILALNTTLNAAVITEPLDFSGAVLTGGVDGQLGAEYTFIGIGDADEDGRQVDAVVTITELTNVTQVRRTPTADISSDGSTITADSSHLLIFAITGTPTDDPLVTPVLKFTLDFSYNDDSSAAVLSNLGFSFSDVDSNLSDTRLYSEFIAADSSQVLSNDLSSNTQLGIYDSTLDGYTAAQLLDFADGNYSSNVDNSTATGSTDGDDYTATFNLKSGSSYDLAFGLIGDSTNTEGNRGGTYAFFTSAPEPSTTLLLGVAFASVCLRRSRS